MSISGIMLPRHSISFLAFDSKFVVVEDFQLQQFYLPSPFPHMQNSTNKLRRALSGRGTAAVPLTSSLIIQV